MKKYVSFFNWHQHGDLYHSRGMVQWIAKHISKDIKIHYYHNRESAFDLFDGDVECLKLKDSTFTVEVDDFNYLYKKVVSREADREYEQLYINTWIATYPEFPQFIPYVSDFPFVEGWKYINAETVMKHTSYIVDIINKTFSTNIPHPVKAEDVIPTVPSSLPHKDLADKLLDITSRYTKRILVCNGPVHSGQNHRFPFNITDVMHSIAKDNPNCAFIYTEHGDFGEAYLSNEFVLDNYIDRPNLNETVYFSTFCDILISRMSGPGCAICVDKNFFNPNLSFICLTNSEDLAHWYKNGTCKYDWTSDYSKESITVLLNKHIGK